MPLPPKTFCWVELGTSDASGARTFYTDLLGFSSDDVDLGASSTYTLLTLEDKSIAGLYTLSEDQKQQGISPHWLSYVLVEDVDASARRAKELGGTLSMGPFDVPNVGRMAMLRDPTGAVFALFQTGGHEGAASMDNKPGMFCWNELATRDTGAAKKFYTELFAWTAEDSDSPMGTHTTFKNAGRLAGGMLTLSDAMGDIPPHWLVYFAVEDCDGAVDKASGTGGRVVVPPSNIPDIGRFSVVTDPQGAAFAVIQLVQPETN